MIGGITSVLGWLAFGALALGATGCRQGQVRSGGDAADECEVGAWREVYSGPPGTEGVGVCRPPIEECQVVDGRAVFQVVQEGVLPSDEIPYDGIDQNCDGYDNVCEEGETRMNYSGPADTQSVGVCLPQIEECQIVDGRAMFQVVQEEVLPSEEVCGDGLDNDCQGETVAEAWRRTFGRGAINSIQQTNDGGFILAAGGLSRTDASGNRLWYRYLCREDHDCNANSARQTSDGGFVLAGDQQYSNLDAQLTITDASGNPVGGNVYGAGFATFYSVLQTSDGGFIAAGAYDDMGGRGSNAWLVRTNGSGREIWNRSFGGPRDDVAHSLQQTSDGGFILAGTIHPERSQRRAWLIRTDGSGTELWSRIFGTSALLISHAHSVQQTSDGGFILAGDTLSGDRGVDAWLIRTDSSGNELWNRTFGGANRDFAYSVRQTGDGGFVLAGAMGCTGTVSGLANCEAWLIRTDASGNELWSRTFGQGTANSVLQTADGGYILAGEMGGDAFLMRVCAE